MVYIYIHTHTHTHTLKYYSAIKEQNNVICSDMGGPRDCHTEWSKSESESQISYDIAYMWNLKKYYKWTYIYKRVIEPHK